MNTSRSPCLHFHWLMRTTDNWRLSTKRMLTHILSPSPVFSSTYRKRNGLISAEKARRERQRSTSGWSSTAMMTPTMVQEQRKKHWRGLKWSKTFTRLCRATGLKRMGNSYVRSHASILGATVSRYMKCYTLLPLRTSFRKQ